MRHARASYNSIQDASGTIPEDEPVFLLRAQDKHAAATVRYWALLVKLSEGDKDIIAAARLQADLMDEWPVKKSLDLRKHEQTIKE